MAQSMVEDAFEIDVAVVAGDCRHHHQNETYPQIHDQEVNYDTLLHHY